ELLCAHKAAARAWGHPFTLLQLRVTRCRRNRGRSADDMLQELLHATARSTDLASMSPAGDAFVLMPKTEHAAGHAVALRVARRAQEIFQDRLELEIRQFTHLHSCKSESLRTAA